MDILRLFDRLRFLDWCSLEDCARLANTSCALSCVAKTRLGCRRCPTWLRPFDEDGEGSLRDGRRVYALSSDMAYRARGFGPEMFCPDCEAIYDFCGRCERPSICLGHAGVAGRAPITRLAAIAPGRGVDDATIEIRDAGWVDEVNISRPGGESIDEECTFYIGDLGRAYATPYEKIGDRVVGFDLTGPDGGQSVFWRCVPCAATYSVSDK
jgi:hypothetical protein